MLDEVWDKVVCRRRRGDHCGVGPRTIIKEVAYSQECFGEDGQVGLASVRRTAVP